MTDKTEVKAEAKASVAKAPELKTASGAKATHTVKHRKFYSVLNTEGGKPVHIPVDTPVSITDDKKAAALEARGFIKPING